VRKVTHKLTLRLAGTGMSTPLHAARRAKAPRALLCARRCTLQESIYSSKCARPCARCAAGYDRLALCARGTGRNETDACSLCLGGPQRREDRVKIGPMRQLERAS
jgi:hypothetical protein